MANITDVIQPPERYWKEIGYNPQHAEKPRPAQTERTMADFAFLSEQAKLDREARACTACTARQEAAFPVPGVGRNTGIIMIGRNPGQDEDIKGSPFVGPSGRVLDIWLSWVGLTRGDVYLTNLVLCHTLADRPVTHTETLTCAKLHLVKYLRLLDPYLVVTFGAETGKFVAGVKKISKEHGDLKWSTAGFWVIPCFHPGAILYDGRMKDDLQYDAIQVQRFLQRREFYLDEWKSRKLGVPDAVPATVAER